MEKYYRSLYSEIINSKVVESNTLKRFIFSSIAHLIIIFYIGFKYKVTHEELCNEISSKIVSRSTIQNILKTGVQLGFFEKELNPNDKREKYYKFTRTSKELMENLFKEKKKFNLQNKVA